MNYTFLITVNFFESHNVQILLKEHKIESVLKAPYSHNITAGWVDPLCNHNERHLLVKSKDVERAKKILTNNLKIKFE